MAKAKLKADDEIVQTQHGIMKGHPEHLHSKIWKKLEYDGLVKDAFVCGQWQYQYITEDDFPKALTIIKRLLKNKAHKGNLS